MKSIRAAAATLTLPVATLLLLTGGTQAYAHHASTKAEREETKELNQQQLQQVRQRNAGLSINANSVATDAAAKLANNSPPAAAPTMPVQQATNLPQMTVAPPTPATGPSAPR